MSLDDSFKVVVLGGNLAGLGTAHNVLRNVLPKLSGAPDFSYRLTLVTPNTHALWKTGVPRTLINEKVKPIDELFLPLQEAFQRYGSNFELIRGMAVGIDEASKRVSVRLTSGSKHLQIPYDALVLSTGTTSDSPLWTLHGGHEKTAETIKVLRDGLPLAQNILIAGGGPAGVESAGEIACAFRKKDITLLSGTDRILKKLRPSIAQEAIQHLNKLGIKVRDNIRVESASKVGSRTSLKLSDGTTMTVDLYIDATGGKPNSSFIPQAWLTPTRFVNTEEHSLRVKGTKGVYCIGDLASYSHHSIYESTHPIPALGFSLWEDFKKDDSSKMKRVEYHRDNREFLIVPIGSKGGVGAYYGWRLPSTVIWISKGRTFLWELFRPIVYGDDY